LENVMTEDNEQIAEQGDTAYTENNISNGI
jgi:hypothetical protein